MESLTRMRLHPLCSQLGVGVDLEGPLVAVDSRMRSLQLRILNRVQQLCLRLYRLCSLHFSRELRI